MVPGSASSSTQSLPLPRNPASKDNQDFKRGVGLLVALTICPRTVPGSPGVPLKILSGHRRVGRGETEEGRALGMAASSRALPRSVIYVTNVYGAPPRARTVLNAGGAGGDRRIS